MAIVLNGTTGIANDGGYTGDGVVFADTTPANTLVTTTGGNVGIGTSSPSQKFHVYNAGSVYTQVQSVNASTGAGAIYKNATANWLIGAGPASGGSEFAFVDQTNGIGNPGERMRIDSSGNLLVGATSAGAGATFGNAYIAGDRSVGSANNYAQVFVQHNSSTNHGIVIKELASSGPQVIFLNSSGTAVGSISTTSSATSYVTSSDYRLKHDIQPMAGALAKVAALKPVIYKWNADDSAGEGFIAHELAEVVPDCVTGEKDAVDADGNPKYQGIDTSFLVATLTAAIQEQQAIITALTARVTALEGA